MTSLGTGADGKFFGDYLFTKDVESRLEGMDKIQVTHDKIHPAVIQLDMKGNGTGEQIAEIVLIEGRKIDLNRFRHFLLNFLDRGCLNHNIQVHTNADKVVTLRPGIAS